MAAARQWSLLEDGCLIIQKNLTGVTYHTSLNAIILSSNDQTITVLDATSGISVKKSDLSGRPSGALQCVYLPEKDRCILSDSYALSVRRDLQGILLLDTALQIPVSKVDDVVKLEITLTDANHLAKCLSKSRYDSGTSDHVTEVAEELDRAIDQARQDTEGSHKTAKWATVCLKLPFSSLKECCNALIVEMKRLQGNSSTLPYPEGLPVVSAILDRLAHLLPSAFSVDTSSGLIDKASMYSEAARRQTFSKWPHMGYKWALPEPMAQAGFYHQPNSPGDDRAMCFTCNVCLVCWEPTDEPWSEHERHSPTCPYIKGDCTQNVPLSVTYATQPAVLHGGDHEIACISSTFNEDFIATSTSEGSVVIWDVSHILKKHCSFSLKWSEAVWALMSLSTSKGSTIAPQDCVSVDQVDSCLAKDKELEESSGEANGELGFYHHSLFLKDTEELRETSLPGSSNIRVCSLSIIDWCCLEGQEQLAGARAMDTAQPQPVSPALLCGVSMPGPFFLPTPRSDGANQDGVHNTACTPHLLLVSFHGLATPASKEQGHCRELDGGGGGGSGGAKSKVPIPADIVAINSFNDTWTMLLENDPWLDPDVQIVGFTPSAAHASPLKDGPNVLTASLPILQNGPSQVTNFLYGSEGSSPQSPKLHAHMADLAQMKKDVENMESSDNDREPVEGRHTGKVIQCLPLPSDFMSDTLQVRSIVPTVDRRYCIVVVAPHPTAAGIHGEKKVGHLVNGTVVSEPMEVDSEPSLLAPTHCQPEATAGYGGLLVYRVRQLDGCAGLEETPCLTYRVSLREHAIKHLSVLPPEVAEQLEEEDFSNRLALSQQATLTTSNTNSLGPVGQVALILADGSMHILNLADSKVISSLPPSDGDSFTASTYCTGIERLCICMASGKLKFYQLSMQQLSEVPPSRVDDFEVSARLHTENKRGLSTEETADILPGKILAGEFLATGVLVPETLWALYSLTLFENLMPRFTATVPPCWSQIHQEQQQRRHPQHLQQQGEATQHTRSWKLNHNGTTWDQHLFEIVLPKPCCVGHVDVKFTLQPTFAGQPNVEVTLLKQNISSMGREAAQAVDRSDKDGVNCVLDPSFLRKNNAEILVGPIKLKNCMSGNSGVVSLSSPMLLNSKPRSLLLHLKGFKDKEECPSPTKGYKDKECPSPNKGYRDVEEQPLFLSSGSLISDDTTDKELAPPSTKKKVYLEKTKTIKNLFDNMSSTMAVPSAVERLAASAPKQKVLDSKGCDCIAELSITVRKFKRTSVVRERQQRNAMLENVSFHERLLSGVICPPMDLQGMNSEHFQNLALDILLWIGAIQINDPSKRESHHNLLTTAQGYLPDLVRCCFISAPRTTAHRCARLLALLLEYSRQSKNPDLAPQLLQALVDSLPQLLSCCSAGAMKWFFTLLNQVKSVDTCLVARTSIDMLTAVAEQYRRNMSPQHALLRTRYGLYGNPFDMDMFDVELPHNLRQPAAVPPAYTSSASKVTSTFGGPITASMVPPPAATASTSNSIGTSGGGASGSQHVREEPDLFEMLTMPLEKSACSQVEFLRNHMLGLLEVEPLTFSCHSTSDGTRVERMDTVSQPPAGSSGTTLSAVPFNMASLGFEEPSASSLLASGATAGPAAGSAASTSGSVMADSLKKLAQMYAKQLHPGYKQIHQLITDHVSKAADVHIPAYVTDSAQGKEAGGVATSSTGQQGPGKTIPYPQPHTLLQPPPDQVMVIDRMHSGARRFVTLDFGKAIVLTDIIIPACTDLASLSIDVWMQGEEIDGQRLVVASDIGTRTLVMNNIMPAPICRYLKIITVGRFGTGTCRSRIPLGPFYGHSYILPWEWREYADTHNYVYPASQLSPVRHLELVSQSSLLQQLSVFVSLAEDLQCRYSLACTRLSSLLAPAAHPQFVSTHVKHYLQRGQQPTGEDLAIRQAYSQCLQLQLQLNLAQRAIVRLHRALGTKSVSTEEKPFSVRLEQTCRDKLRGIMEGLLDTLLTLTVPVQPSHSLTLTVPAQPPHSLYLALNPSTAESLFRNLCLLGSRRIQVSAGLLLSRVCSSQAWWGVFLSNVLRELFHSEYSLLFPQDRVFVLLSTLSQKALCGPNSAHILDSILNMLSSVLQPLLTPQGAANLDLGLVSWILLFLCRNFDSALAVSGSEGPHREEREGLGGGRWNFIHGSLSGPCGVGGKSKSRKLFSRNMHRRIMHHKQRLQDIEMAKSMFEKAKDKVSQVVLKEAGSSSSKKEALLKEQESLEKELALIRSKHFKDLLCMRRNDLEVLRRLPREEREGGGGRDQEEEEGHAGLLLPRERCLRVVHGLVALVLSMDFSCHVDLLLIACKVLAKMCTATRPALTLGEVMSQEQLEQVMVLVVGQDPGHASCLWGGPWAAHAISCLLLDILEGERQYPGSLSSSSSEDPLNTDMGEAEEPFAQSTSAYTDDGTDDDLEAGLESNGAEVSGQSGANLKDTNLMMDLLLEDVLEDECSDTSDIQPSAVNLFPFSSSAFTKTHTKKSIGSNTGPPNADMVYLLGSPVSSSKIGLSKKASIEQKNRQLQMRSMLNELSCKSGGSQQRLSLAQDARLEYSLQWLPDLRIKTMLSSHVEGVFSAFSSPVPLAPQLPHTLAQPSFTTTATDDQLSQSALPPHSVRASASMLSECFNQLFGQLSSGRVGINSVLNLWLTINHCGCNPRGVGEEPLSNNFNSATVPSFPLSAAAVEHLMAAVMAMTSVTVHTWVLIFHTLSLMINQRPDTAVPLDDSGGGGREGPLIDGGGVGVGLSSVVLTHPDLLPLIIKFLSAGSSSNVGMQFFQVGPTACRAFDDFIQRLVCKSVHSSLHNLKELLLKIVYQLTAERGAIFTCTGPLDAQCQLVETVAGMTFEAVELSNAMSVVAAIATQVQQYVITLEPLSCSSTHDTSIKTRSCFSGLFASLLRGRDMGKDVGGEPSREQLMCYLLRLATKLVQVPIPGSGGHARATSSEVSMEQAGMQESMSDAAKLDWAFSTSVSSQAVATSPMSDDEKRQQGSAVGGSTTACGLGDIMNRSGRESSSESRPGLSERCTVDIIVGNLHIMQSLLQALSYSDSSKMALLVSPLPQSAAAATSIDPSSMGQPSYVGDAIFHLLCTLQTRTSDPNSMTETLYKYLGGHYPQQQASMLCRLTEPLLRFLLRTLHSTAAVQHFVTLGGMEVVCSNLVRCSRQFISVGPSIISTIMHSMAAPNLTEDKSKLAEEAPEGHTNYAPLGTITCPSPTASPPDPLIQVSAPHRRARTAAWSYHFYPNERWVELVLTLPFAILLKEVHIRPHNGSLTTCPASVSLELSQDGLYVVPVAPPLVTASLALIKLQLLQPAVVSAVTLRLLRPRDSSSVGLQQICLMGQRACGEEESSNTGPVSQEAVTQYSIGWLRLLHHCLQADREEVARAAAPTPNLINTCTSLLVSPAASVYCAKIQAVLLCLALTSVDLGLALIDNILRTPVQCGNRGLGHIYLGRVSGIASPYTVEILYQLGTTQDCGTSQRLRALLQWLADTAQAHLRQQSSSREDPLGFMQPLAATPSSDHVHCVAAILWYSHENSVTYDLPALLTTDLMRCLYDWACSLPVGSLLKKAVGSVLCSICHIHPPYFHHIMLWAGFLGCDISAADTDDSKDTAQHQGTDSGAALTDDCKEAGGQPCREQTETMTDDSKEASRLTHSHQALSQLALNRGQLETVAVVCQSPSAVSQLLDCGLLTVLVQALLEFCSREITLVLQRAVLTEAQRVQQQQPSADNGPREAWHEPEASNSDLTPEFASLVLTFFAELCCEPDVKEWLGSGEGNVFWPSLLTMLCNTQQPSPVPAQAGPNVARVLSMEERSKIESAAILFFTRVITCHSVNQMFFAKVLCDIIREQGTQRTGALLGTMPLSGFTRRLLLEVLLEDEKVMVALRASPDQCCHLATLTARFPYCQIHHPRFRAGRGSACILVNVNSPCSMLLTGGSGMAAWVTSSVGEHENGRMTEDFVKDNADLGIEVMDYINAAGVFAKEKREKSPSPSKASLPPRPPTRRGLRPSDSTVPATKVPQLQHALMTGKVLPKELTFSQLIHILLHRGLPSGTTALELTVTGTAGLCASTTVTDGACGTSSLEPWQDKPEDIPDEVLLASPAFPSALEVFASVGGLALLAEHLPLLYPDINRQGAGGQEATTENNNLGDLGQDWVTVESSDELYDPYMEPVSPAPATCHTARHVASAMPTIPPHSLIAFGLFLRLPGYAEVLLKERKKAQCLLRLVLGVTDDGDGGHILTSAMASSLPTLPFSVLRSLLDTCPLTTDDGVVLRRVALDIGALHLVLACLSHLSHHPPRVASCDFRQETQMILTAMQTAESRGGLASSEEKTQHYWAKGTGFGTGSTTCSWDAEQALLRQRSEEEHVACLLQVLSSYINPGGQIPTDFLAPDGKDKSTAGDMTSSSGYTPPCEKWLLPEVVSELLSQSCLIPSISSYLRNDSVLDMARHVPLYRALLQLLRGMAVCPRLVPLLLPMTMVPSNGQQEQSAPDTAGAWDWSVSVEKLLSKMKGCVDTYASRLQSNKGKITLSSKVDEEESEGLALLIPDIQDTATIVSLATQRLKAAEDHPDGGSDGAAGLTASSKSNEERYLDLMGPLQFETYELVTETSQGLKFNVAHHFESQVKATGAFTNPSRTRRLAQEAVTLSTSLPLSYSSSVYVRCDEDRLDVMKVLITGPSDTPYANGAFEFDVYFPQDYPNSPPYINLQTTGNHTVRFNPNLYNDGKVCLSILNTWHGRPEEKWNAQTSSFLQVLVSIQSLILVSEPYFNEPGYERSRGSSSGMASSREYDANIRQATVKWAMLEQIRKPSACFREVIHYHFWLKRHEVLKQCEDWIAEMEQYSTDKRTGRSISHSTLALKRHYNQLREELAKLKPPTQLQDEVSNSETIDPKGKQYSTDPPQTLVTASTPASSSGNAKLTVASSTSSLSGSSGVGLGPYVGPNGMFFGDPVHQDLPDV